MGSIVFGIALDCTKAFKPLLKICTFLAMACVVWFLLALQPNNEPVLLVAFGSLGFFMMPLLPICLETAAECTFPASEESSSGMMMSLGNVISIFMVMFIREMLDAADTCTHSLRPFTYAFAAVMLVSLIFVFSFDGEYLRLEEESKFGDPRSMYMAEASHVYQMGDEDESVLE